MIDHAHRDDAAWLALLERQITEKHLVAGDGDPVAWAKESQDAAQATLVLPGTNIDEGYYEKNIGLVETRVELAGLRLTKILNTTLAKHP